MEQQGDQVQFLLSDFNTRLREIDERNKLVRERVLLLGKNLISSREELEEIIKEIKQDNIKMKEDIKRLKKVSASLLNEFGSFVKQDEMMVIERMLKDFQPLDFMRKKDIEELIENKLNEKSKKQIKTFTTK